MFIIFVVDSVETGSLDNSENKHFAKNSISYEEFSSDGEPKKETDDSIACDEIQTSNGFSIPQMVSWHIFWKIVSPEPEIFKK